MSIQSLVWRIVLLASILVWQAPGWGAEEESTAPRSGLGRFLSFFSSGAAVPEDLSAALASYRDGRDFEALVSLARAGRDSGAGPFRDDIECLRGLILSDLGWREPALRSFRSVLEASEPSPYFPLALLGLIELHDGSIRPEAVAEAHRRYFDGPWRGSDRKSLLIKNFLLAYGNLRAADERRTREELHLLAHPTELVQELRDHRERPSERLVYLAGLALLRIGAHAESIEALRRIGLESPYFPYALYAIAQNHHALGEIVEANGTLDELTAFPAPGDEVRALVERAGLLRTELCLKSHSYDEALAVASRMKGGGFYAQQSVLLRAEIYLETDKPSLAVAYYRGLDATVADPRLEAGRGLGLSSAYSALGDFHAASGALRAASAAVGRTRSDGGEASLRGEAERWIVARDAADRRRRARLSAGIGGVLSFKESLDFGKVARIVLTRRNTILGESIYDLEQLVAGEPFEPSTPSQSPSMWFAYLRSRERPTIEAALASLSANRRAVQLGAREQALRALDTGLEWLEGRFPLEGSEDRTGVVKAVGALAAELRSTGQSSAPLELDPQAPLEQQVAAYRERLLVDLRPPAEGRSLDRELVARLQAEILRAVEDAARLGIRRVMTARDEMLRGLEHDLDIALSRTLALESATTSSIR